MTSITYPSADFPAPVRLSMDCPEGWNPLPDSAQCLAVMKSVPQGQFHPNVFVVVRRMRKGTGMQTALAELRQRIAGLNQYASVGEEERLIDGWPGYRAEGSFIDETAGTLIQAIRLAVVDRGPAEDLVQVTAMCHATQVEDTWQQIRSIQDSLTITVPSA